MKTSGPPNCRYWLLFGSPALSANQRFMTPVSQLSIASLPIRDKILINEKDRSNRRDHCSGSRGGGLGSVQDAASRASAIQPGREACAESGVCGASRPGVERLARPVP